MARIFFNNTLNDNMFSVWEYLDTIGAVKVAITQDIFKNLYQCIHFLDDWEADNDTEWYEYLLSRY